VIAIGILLSSMMYSGRQESNLLWLIMRG